MWNLKKKKSDTSNNTGNWNDVKVIQKIPEQLTWKAQRQDSTQNSHTGHRTHVSESANGEVQDIHHGK